MINKNIKILQNELSRRDKDIYDLVYQLRYGLISSFATDNENITDRFSWSMQYNKEGKPKSVIGLSCNSNKFYFIDFIPELYEKKVSSQTLIICWFIF